MKPEAGVGAEMFKYDSRSYWMAYEMSDSFRIGFYTSNGIRCFWSLGFGSFSSNNWSD